MKFTTPIRGHKESICCLSFGQRKFITFAQRTEGVCAKASKNFWCESNSRKVLFYFFVNAFHYILLICSNKVFNLKLLFYPQFIIYSEKSVVICLFMVKFEWKITFGTKAHQTETFPLVSISTTKHKYRFYQT